MVPLHLKHHYKILFNMTYMLYCSISGVKKNMTQNCKLDKRVGSKTWVERIFITAMLGSRLDAFVYRTILWLWDNQSLNCQPFEWSIICLQQTNLALFHDSVYSLTFLIINWHWQVYHHSKWSMSKLKKYSKLIRKENTANQFMGHKFKSSIGANTKPH